MSCLRNLELNKIASDEVCIAILAALKDGPKNTSEIIKETKMSKSSVYKKLHFLTAVKAIDKRKILKGTLIGIRFEYMYSSLLVDFTVVIHYRDSTIKEDHLIGY